jgi:4-amino-4-deoxy-L-arabinose transferase-like glycosyltransferase
MRTGVVKGISKWPGLLLAAALLACCLWLRVQNVYRVGTVADEGVIIAIAEQMSRGKALYHDLFLDHPPGLTLALSGLFRLFGADIVYPRLLAASASTMTCLLVLLIGWRGSNFATGLFATLFFTLDPLNLFWSKFVFSEPFYNLFEALFIFLFLLALTLPKSRPLLAVASGLAAGLAFQIKQTGALVVVAAAALLLWETACPWPASGRKAAVTSGVRLLALVAGGFLVACAIVPLYLWSAPPGTPGDYLTAVYGLNYPAPAHLAEKLAASGAYALRRPTVILALASVPLIVTTRRDAASRLLLLWGLAEYGLLLLVPHLEYSFEGFSHYVVSTAAPTALLAALFFGHFWQKAGGHFGSARRVLGSTWPGLLALLVGAATLPGCAADFRQAMSSKYPVPGFAQEKEIGVYVQGITAPDDRILVFSNSIFYHWSRRDPPGRFIFYSSKLLETSIRNEMLYEISQEIQDARTKAILVSTPFLYDARISPLAEMIRQLYQPAQQLPYDYQDQVLILQRRPEEAAPYISPLPTSFASPGELPIQHRLEVRLDDKITFLGHSQDVERVRAAGRATLTLFWRGEAPVGEDYTIFVHLVDGQNRTVAQADHQVFDGLYPTSSWQRGEVIQDRFWLTVPPDVKPGEYRLRAGMYDAATLRRLPLAGDSVADDAINLGLLTVVARSVEEDER